MSATLLITARRPEPVLTRVARLLRLVNTFYLPCIATFEHPVATKGCSLGRAPFHYANCAEGANPDDLTAPCTLMFNFVDFQGIGFSSPNTAVVRGHSWDYAR